MVVTDRNRPIARPTATSLAVRELSGPSTAEASSTTRSPPALREKHLDLGNIVERIEDHDNVERIIRVRQPPGVELLECEPGAVVLARDVQQGR